MKNLFQRTCCVCSLMLTLNSSKAQVVITEYLSMKESFKIDLNDRKVQKSVYTKGVLDIDWNPSSFTLAVSYDPKQTESKDILKNIQELSGSNNSTIFSRPSGVK